jgi:hypothetical protein
MKMDMPAKARFLGLFAVACALLGGCGPSQEDLGAIRLVRQDVTTLSNAAAARDPVAVFNAIEDRVSIPVFAKDNTRRLFPRDAPPMSDYLDAERAADEISASLTRAELEHAGIKITPYIEMVIEGNHGLGPDARLVLYQRIERDCARAFAGLHQ